MKKIFLTLGFLLTFCIASAQTDTISTQTPEQTRMLKKKSDTKTTERSNSKKTKARKANATADTISPPTTTKKRKNTTTPPAVVTPQ